MDASSFVPALSVFGAVIVAVANYLVQRWRYRLDRLGLAVDNLCKEINDLSDIATGYWLLDAGKSDEALKAEQIVPLMLGRELRIQQLIMALGLQDSRLSLIHVNAGLIGFYAALTGGAFEVGGRSPDIGRARDVQAEAARLNGELRTAMGNRPKIIL